MTWVLGANLEFGSVLIAADIRITLPDKREVDGLQKIYPLGYNIIGGFAGSVTIGLDILSHLTQQFALSPPGSRWELGAVALTWLPRVIRHRVTLHKQYRDLGASFLIGSVSPSRNVRKIFPETKLYVFRSASNFKAEEIAPGEAGSIGNGQSLEDPVRAILKTNEFRFAWNSGPRLQSFILAEHLRNRILEQPKPGVSPRFMMGWVVRGDQGIEPWTTRDKSDKGIPITEKTVVARSVEELNVLVGSGAAEAVG